MGAGLIAAGAALRRPALGPSSYWLDDAWVALASRAGSVADFVDTAFTAPLFNHLTGLILRLADAAPLAGQAVPFAAGSALAGLAYWGLRAFGAGRLPALAAALAAVFSPVSIVYATRVKPYTGEALLAGALVLLAVGVAHRRVAPARYAAVSAVGVLWSATVGVAAVAALGAAFAVRSIDARRPDVETARWLAGAVVALLAYWGLYLRSAVPDRMYDYWESSFVRVGSVPGFARSVVSQTSKAADALLPLSAAGVGVLAASALVVLWRCWREALVVLAPFAATIAASALGLIPYGGGRTDIHLLAPAVGTVGLALREAARHRPVGLAAAAAAGAALLAAGVARYEPPVYPGHDLRPLVEMVEARASPGDLVMVYPSARYSFALYTESGIEIIADDGQLNGFTVDVANPDVAVLKPSVEDPDAHGPAVLAATQGREVVWYLGTHFKEDDAVIASFILAAGFAETDRAERPGARAIRYERR